MKGRLLKKAAALALAALLVTGGVPVQPIADMASEISITASAAETVTYYENGVQKTANATLLNPTNDNRTIQSGWYYTTTETYLFPVTISGTVNIILTDGKAAVFENGLILAEGNTLNIYPQSEGTGRLYANSHEYSNAAIGGGSIQNFGTLNVYGGIIKAENIKSGSDAAAIGGGYKGSGGTINIYGGSVTADAGQSGNGAGIGSGSDVQGTNGITGGNISIYGGTVVADGGSSCGAGIGGGYQSSGGNIAIYGGNVTATGGSNSINMGAAGIGGGSARGCESITISGGVVNANGGYGSAAIGCGNGYMGNPSCGNITISGGQITTSIRSYDYAIGKGVGGGYNGTCDSISLGWSNADDFLKLDSVNGTVQFTKDFVYENNLTSPVTVGNADWSKKIVPAYSIGTNATHCTINVPSAAGIGATVNLIVTPDNSYDIQSVTVGNTAVTRIDDTRFSFVMPASNVTVSAECVQTYTVTWKNADGTVLETDTNVSYGATPTYNGATPTKEGNSKYTYTFNGWTPTVSAVTGDAEYTATFTITPKSYTVTYKVDGETYGNVDTVAYGTALTAREAPTKTGYTFSGWSEIPAAMPDEDVVITGTFTLNQHTVTYKVDGETYSSIDTVAYGTALTARDEPEARTGYTFSGWSNIPTTMPDNDVVITGTFTANTYTVHFDPVIPVNGEMADQTFTYDEDAKALTKNNFSTTTGEWLNWNTKPDGTGTTYTDEQFVRNLTDENGGTVTLYAQWHLQKGIFFDQSIFDCVVNGESGRHYYAYPGESVQVFVNDNSSVHTVHVYTITDVNGGDYIYGDEVEFNTTTNTFIMPDQQVHVTSESKKRMEYTRIYLDDFESYNDVVYLYDAQHPTVTPTVVVKDYDNNTLTEGTDYTLTITNNTGSPDEMVTATVTITGMGDYIGTNTKEFRISPFNIANCTLKGRLEAYDDGYGVNNSLEANVEVWNGDTQLDYYTDYEIEIEFADPYVVGQTYTATINGMGDWGGSKTFSFKVIELAHTVVFNANGGEGTMESFTLANDGGYAGRYTLPDCTFTPPTGYEFDHWVVSCEPGEEKQPGDYFTAPYIYNESYVTTITVKAVWKDVAGAHLAGHTLILGDDIGVNFYMELSDAVKNSQTAKMIFTIPDNGGTRTEEVFVKDVSHIDMNGKTYYIFPCHVAAKEMTSDIKAQIVDYGADVPLTGAEYTYTVKQYANYIINHPEEFGEEAVALVKAMLYYGGTAQTLFDFRTGDMASAALGNYTPKNAPAAFDTCDLSNVNAKANSAGLRLTNVSLVLESKTTLRLYFKRTDAATTDALPNLTYGTNIYEPQQKDGEGTDGEYYYDITDFTPGGIFAKRSVSFNGGSSFSVGIGDYCNWAMTNGSSELKATITALYNYDECAKAYKDGLGQGGAED